MLRIKIKNKLLNYIQTQRIKKVNIEINESDQLIKCTIIDLNGRTVYSKTSKELDFSIDLNSLPSGVYYVNVKYYNGISREKLIIQ